MKTKIEIRKQNQLPERDILPLLQKSQEEGFEFIDRLITEYSNGDNRFDKPGEILLAAYINNSLLAVGGLNQDPYLSDTNIGRVRHVYVLPTSRRQGLGAALMKAIISHAADHFQILTLRTFNPKADLFYQYLGFQAGEKFPNSSHFLHLSK